MKFLLIIISILISFTLLSGRPECSGSTTKVSKVLILGNSITIKSPAPALGWYNNWGMAATAPDSDYVHRLIFKMKAKNPNIEVNYGSIATDFERTFWNVNYKDKEFASFKDFNADLIIIRIGDNINDNLANEDSLGIHLSELVNYVSSNRNVNVCMTSSFFWPRKNINRIIDSLCTANNWTFVNLNGLFQDPANTSYDRFTNRGVGAHPSDAGMRNIADRIWQNISKFF
jgi:hypothetical protein